MTLITLICGTPGLPLSQGALAHAEWRGTEQLNTRTRGGAIVAPVQMPVQGTSLPTAVLTVDGKDFPYIPVRAGEPVLT
jgi:hypothetical protein